MRDGHLQVEFSQSKRELVERVLLDAVDLDRSEVTVGSVERILKIRWVDS